MSAQLNSPEETGFIVDCTARIVAAYVGSNRIQGSELPAIIDDVHRSLAGLSARPAEPVEAAPLVPAVPVKKSVHPEHLICLEDGQKFQSLRRHLRVKYNLTPEQYRAKWGLPVDYPMTAPNYSMRRSELARTIGLGRPKG
ncbi:MucR family transcriptional regulator [Bosea sp. RAC05]|uniref:MucR family transcriptional regulator n=1 Tax=Bosea sp. RAC05 TaxID=1842539 RepID=UPI00083DC741|nr:MucR family transcriptional regulator [Bosea sp. RAC05]AOG03484.1 ROS/MUCR transcriptional regulator family protein [Bosea sp. RAC05]